MAVLKGFSEYNLQEYFQASQICVHELGRKEV
jgi:hypothetical protein